MNQETMPKKQFLLLALAVLIPAFLLYGAAHMLCQHRADYADGITFVGQSRWVVGSLYTRVYMWRDASDTSPLPDVTIHLDEQSYPLSEFTEEVAKSLGGTSQRGSFRDAKNNVLQYRFENDRLTWFSLDSDLPPSNFNNVTTLSLSVNNGPGFSLPITDGDLVKQAGKPQRAYLSFAQ